MANQPKPKKSVGERNSSRRNGKAPKQNPKQPTSRGKSWAEREAERQARREPLHQAYLEDIERQKVKAAEAAEAERIVKERKTRMSKSQAKRVATQQAASKVKRAHSSECMEANMLPCQCGADAHNAAISQSQVQ